MRKLQLKPPASEKILETRPTASRSLVTTPGAFKTLVDGQDSTNIYAPGFFFYQQPSVEALEEVSLQTGNYAAEFGQAQGGIYNFAAKVGNQ